MLDNASPFLIEASPRPQSRNDIALQRLRQALIAGDIRPGAGFGEAEIAERFRLGRAAVRVALTALAASGFVARQPRQGWRAAPITGAAIGDLVRARRALEPALIEVRRDERVQARLMAAAQIGAAAISAGDRKALSTARLADRQVLDGLAQSVGSPPGGSGMTARWLGEAWDHSTRVAHLLDGLGVAYWPSDRRPLLIALGENNASAAAAELAGDIARFERACVAALLNSPGFGADAREPNARIRARRRNKPSPPADIGRPTHPIER